MTDITINITIPEINVARFSAVVDTIWPGRATETKVEWTKRMIIANLKQQVLRAEKELQNINEIEIT